MKYLLSLLILLNITDGVLTHFVIELGLGSEGNPFLLNLVGEPSFIILKAVGAFVCAFILWDIHRRHPRLAFFSTSVFVAFYIGIVTWNSAVFLL
ncbi:MAG: hypothetical protein JSV77_09730 [Dehalococcoidales bacterium]|nr:MAG: hypothetical protein JSV77_09730 [Dehalococcoidales bacterium]